MNVIFATQGEYALFYLELLPLLSQRLSLGQIGFYVTNKSNYPKYSRKAKSSNLELKFLKGWEITDITDEKLDNVFLNKAEEEFGEPFLWDTLVMDRRVYNGILTKYKQDYKPRFAHTEMLLLLQRGFRSVLEFIKDIKPDVIIGGFTPVTFVEYIFYLCAKARGIKYINLNPTKISNYVTFSEEIYREFPHVEEDYKKYLTGNDDDDLFLEKAKGYLESKVKKYEGVIVFPAEFPYRKWLMRLLRWPLVIANYYLKKRYQDNQQRGCHWGYFYKNIYNPVKDKAAQWFLPYYPVEKLSRETYAYYPLHVEPEIAISMFGKEYLNQIELIRNIARSIPVSWKLVVKDHPAGVGRRNIRYYKKLLEIPNVVLVNHYVGSERIIENAKMIFTVSGFSGFEAILRNKSVITFGKTFYAILPEYMVRNVRALQDLPETVNALLKDYQYSEKEVICLIAAIIKNSTPLNLYEEVLKKEGRVTVEGKRLVEQRNDFVDFLARQMQTV